MQRLTHSHKENSAIIISSRIRLARNLAGRRFVQAMGSRQLNEVYTVCAAALCKIKKLRGYTLYDMGALTDFDREILAENRIISKELGDADKGRGAYVSRGGGVSVFINEEDHIRIQAIDFGLELDALYKKADAIDDEIEERLEYAYSDDIGYITSCPTNMGTGMRASVMMHLPALSASMQIDKITRALNQLGMVVRGANGEGSDSVNAFFQLSNQQTLGVSEDEIIQKIKTYCKKICQFEIDARYKALEDDPLAVFDKFLRARATLENCKLIDSEEAVANLSVLRLAADMNFMGSSGGVVEKIDELSTDVLPCHLQNLFDESAVSERRDVLRARYLNEAVAELPPINTKSIKHLL